MGQAVVQLRQCEEREQKVHKKLSTSLSELDGARRFIDRLRQRATGADADRQRLLASIAEMTVRVCCICCDNIVGDAALGSFQAAGDAAANDR